MPAGMEAITTSGVIQVDSTAPCMCLRQQGTSTLSTLHAASRASGTVLRQVDVTVTASTPLMALYGTGSYGIMAVTKPTSTQFTFRIVGTGSTTVQWFLFDKPVVTASGAGAELYDASGNIQFSSFFPPMQVVGFFGNTSPGGDGAGSLSLSGTKLYAIAFNAGIYEEVLTESYTDGTYEDFWSYKFVGALAPTTGTTKVCSLTTTTINGGTGSSGGITPGTGLTGWGSPSKALVIDVTAFA